MRIISDSSVGEILHAEASWHFLKRRLKVAHDPLDDASGKFADPIGDVVFELEHRLGRKVVVAKIPYQGIQIGTHTLSETYQGTRNLHDRDCTNEASCLTFGWHDA